MCMARLFYMDHKHSLQFHSLLPLTSRTMSIYAAICNISSDIQNFCKPQKPKLSDYHNRPTNLLFSFLGHSYLNFVSHNPPTCNYCTLRFYSLSVKIASLLIIYRMIDHMVIHCDIIEKCMSSFVYVNMCCGVSQSFTSSSQYPQWEGITPTM